MPTRMLIDTRLGGTSGVDQFTLPLQSNGVYSFDIDWGDGTSDTITAWNDAATTHTYATAGEYEISITGTLTGFRFNNGGDKLKLLESREFHSGFLLGNSGNYYWGCSNHRLFASGLNTSGTTNFSYAWLGNALTSFPAIDLSNGTSFSSAWRNNALTSFPAIDLSNGTDFSAAWDDNALTSFPAIDLSNGTNFSLTWRDNALSTASYSDLLIRLATENTNIGVTLHGGSSKYEGEAINARAHLTDTLGWNITDGGIDPNGRLPSYQYPLNGLPEVKSPGGNFEIEPGTTIPQIPFALLGGAPDATPVVSVYAGSTLLGTATVTTHAESAYFASYTLPGSGIADRTPIYYQIDYEIGGTAQPSQSIFIGTVGLREVDLSAIESTLGTPAGASIAADVAAVDAAIDAGINVTVTPLTGVVESRVRGTTIEVFTGETTTVSIATVDAQGNSVDYSGSALSVVIESKNGTDKATIADGSITKNSSTISFAVPAAVTATEATYRWALRDTADDGVLMQGPLIVTYAPEAD